MLDEEVAAAENEEEVAASHDCVDNGESKKWRKIGGAATSRKSPVQKRRTLDIGAVIFSVFILLYNDYLVLKKWTVLLNPHAH